MVFLIKQDVYIVVQPSWEVNEMKIRGVLLISFLLFVSFFVAGCFQGEQTFEEVDVPEEITIEEDDEVKLDEFEDDEAHDESDEVTEDAVTETEETVLREIYLLDAEGLVVPQMLELPKTESAALTTLQHMVKEGPVTELLPNGFQAVLPAHTEIIGMNLTEDGTLIIDVSEEMTNYEAKDEVKILEAMTHTMTQFDKVERIQLWINGEEQTEMPVNGTPISKGYSKDKGINVFIDSKPNIQSSEAVTVYYPKQHHEQLYYVPVTQYFDATDHQLYESVVKSMVNGPKFGVQTAQVFNDGSTLVEKPVLKEGVLQLVFNDNVLKDQDKSIIADEVIETLVKSLTALEDVDAVQIKVKDRTSLIDENGSTYDRPVTLQDIKAREKM